MIESSNKRLRDEVYVTPIKDIINTTTKKDVDGLQVLLSLDIEACGIISSELLRQEKSTGVVDNILKLLERQLFILLQNVFLKSRIQNIDIQPKYVYGLPYRIISDVNIEEGALVILTPKKYHELREKECNSRQGWIFTD